jgi:hypothetical protein
VVFDRNALGLTGHFASSR